MKELSGLTIVKDKKAAKIYVDPKGADFDGLSLVAKSFAKDISLVTGVVPTIITDVRHLEATVVVVGSIGNNDFIDALIAEGRVEVSSIINKWECYKLQVVDNPAAGIDTAVVIVGSDKRGTIYGIYHVSELIGVSPWVYWGDVTPAKQMDLIIPESKLNMTSREPSVKYRGFFLNDDWPSLGTWTTNKFGDFNEEFYDKVFELILRIKGNYLWPAMWSAIFSENGKSSKTANAQLADAYGIIMGTSHHEAMFCAGEEWQKNYQKYGTSNEWDFTHNKEAITRFWEDAVIRNKAYENLITLGMRGERDSALGGDLQANIDLLKDIITIQKGLLCKYGISDAPQVLTLYKEVEKFWHGTDTIPGLKTWDVLNNVTIMLAEDNYGNLRTLPEPEERNREAGWGMYYHFDYHGGPRSYEWVNVMPIEKTWEQMSMAFDYGVRDIWIVNVGDLKPMEFPISYFFDLAYDFDTWGTKGINKTKEYTKQWVCQQFGHAARKASIDGITKVLADYTRMNGICKPEVVTPKTYSITNYNEARRVLAKAIALENDAKKYYDLMPEIYKDTYYQLIYYPAVASVNVTKMQIYAGFNHYYHGLGNVLANKYAKLVEEAINTDKQMQSYYNDKMSKGKWQGIMSSPHIGYTNWDSKGWQYPQINYVNTTSDTFAPVDLESIEAGYTSDTDVLPTFTDANVTSEVIDVRSLSEMTFVGKDDVISIEAEHAFNRVAKSNVEWKVIENYGRTLSSVKMYPTTISFEKIEDAPYLEYKILVDNDGEYTLTVYTAPTNNLSINSRLSYGVSFDGVNPVIAASLQADYIAGDHSNLIWCKGVLDNIHIMTTTHQLAKGTHVLRFYGLDAGLVLQKLVLSKGALPASYLGPQESYYKK